MFSVKGGSSDFLKFVFPVHIIFDEGVGDEEDFVSDGNQTDLGRPLDRDPTVKLFENIVRLHTLDRR